jgi:hypothetical protein
MDGWQIIAIVLCASFLAGMATCLILMPGRLDGGKDSINTGVDLDSRAE